VKAAALPLLVTGGALLLAGCLSERPRPAPPQLAIVLSKKTVHSPDTLRGTMHAEDPDGIDSVWLAVGLGPPLALDGLLDTVFDAPFVFVVARGYPPGDRLPVKLSARDVAGFRGELDTIVTVTP